MTDMTPGEARKILDDGFLNLTETEMNLYLEDALRALAADTLEYRVEHQHIDNGMWHPITKWSPEWPLNDGYSVAPDERIVCRRVSHPWEVTDG